MNPEAVWDPEYHKVFVDLCTVLKQYRNTPRMEDILELFPQMTGARFDINQLENHWDTMAKHWKVWCRLIQCNEMKWDPETKTFGASDHDWANYLQVNPDAEQYRLSPPLFLNKLVVIFKGINIDEEAASDIKRKRRRKLREEENNIGDEDMMSRGSWSLSSHEMFLDLFVQETKKLHIPENCYPKKNWKVIHERINNISGKGFTIMHVKNHWDITRKCWKIWCQLIGASIMKWDPKTRTFGATEEEWEIYLKENPRTRRFRHRQIPFADKLAIIFKGVIEPGKTNYYPYRRAVPDHHDDASDADVVAYDNSIDADDNAVDTDDGYVADGDVANGYVADVVAANDNAAAEVADGYVADNVDDVAIAMVADGYVADVDVVAEPSLLRRRLNNVGFEDSNLQDVEIVTPLIVSGKESEYTIRECIEYLNTMKEVKKVVNFTCLLIKHREIFMELKKSSLRITWLARQI